MQQRGLEITGYASDRVQGSGGADKGEAVILAIDPGCTDSAFVMMTENFIPTKYEKVTNDDMLNVIENCEHLCSTLVIEMIASYGMPVGKEVFDTCIWIGRFTQVALDTGMAVKYVTRNEVKQNLCHSSKANDVTIKQALVDRFAYNVPNHGKGSKSQQGWFYGFRSDVWASYAVGVTYLDKESQ